MNAFWRDCTLRALLSVAEGTLLFLAACTSGGTSTGTQVGTPSTGSSSPIAGSGSAAPDPLQGIWHTAELTRSDVVDAFMAAGGSKSAGAAFFAQLGGGTRHTVMISIQFQDGIFMDFEAADGGAPHEAYLATYKESTSSTMILTSTNPGDRCVGTYAFDVKGDVLRLHALDQCKDNDGPYNTTLFASFPYTK
jgi:hypothetical protein